MSWTLSGSNPAPTGTVYFTFSGQVPATYIILASTNLITWTPLATNIVLSGTVQFTNSTATNYPTRFYWVVVQ